MISISSIKNDLVAIKHGIKNDIANIKRDITKTIKYDIALLQDDYRNYSVKENLAAFKDDMKHDVAPVVFATVSPTRRRSAMFTNVSPRNQRRNSVKMSKSDRKRMGLRSLQDL